ncbi:Lsr2 dimerization domain-containing protein [Prescottella agglutinans]|uniref:Lsr2 dimerization domain-containing protein n=1 Tax=Prescottella agglutinans TaxID=1644129 RepID=UPI003D955BCE
METFDDLDGKKIDFRGETIEFSLNRIEYAIDLRAGNATQLRGLVGGYIRHARRVGGHKRWAAIGPTTSTGLDEVRARARVLPLGSAAQPRTTAQRLRCGRAPSPQDHGDRHEL